MSYSSIFSRSNLFILTLIVLMLFAYQPVGAHPPAHTPDSAEQAGDNASDKSQGGKNAPKYVPNQVVVKLTPNGATTIEAINATYATTTVAVLLQSADIYLLGTEKQAQATAAQLRKDDRIAYAELNYLVDSPEANPQGEWAFGSDDLTIATEANPQGEWAFGGESADQLETQYALNLIDITAGHAVATGNGVTVAVLDTGVQADHPLLADAVITGYDFVDDDNDSADIANGIDDDDDGLIDEAAGHGTHIAGIIHMVAPQATIMPVRVLDSDGRGNLFLITEAISYAADNGADVINLSLGIPFKSRFLEDVIDAVSADGVLIIAAAGNQGSNKPQYPAGFANVVAVTATDETMQQLDFANYGWWVDMAAPGKSIYSAFPNDNYAWWSGTSMAAPFVAGTAALLIDAQPDMASETLLSQLVGESWGQKNRDPNSAEAIPFLNLTTIFMPD